MKENSRTIFGTLYTSNSDNNIKEVITFLETQTIKAYEEMTSVKIPITRKLSQ